MIFFSIEAGWKRAVMEGSIRMLKKMTLVAAVVGMTILPASRLPTEQVTKPGSAYTVRSGDSLYTIARKLGTTVKALRAANGLEEGALLHPGQKLIVPDGRKGAPIGKGAERNSPPAKNAKKKRTSAPGVRYTVRPGDTPSTIAERYGITTRELLRANGMRKDSLIRVGQRLLIPGGEKAISQKAKKASGVPKRKKGEKGGNTLTKNKAKTKKGIHVVRYGDTLFSIARKYHTPLKDLMQLNGISPTDVIHPGQELKIPGSSYRRGRVAAKTKKSKNGRVEKKKPLPPLVYTVRHGDTLWEIARRHKVTVTQIRRLNRMKRGDVIRSGMKLVIREGREGSGAVKLARTQRKERLRKQEKFYTVRKGDTLWEIARRYKTSVAELRRLNGMKRGDVIRTGMKLTVGYEKVPPTRLAAREKGKKKPTAVSRKKRGKSSTRIASAGKKKGVRKRRRSADRRINSALAALNGRSSGGGGSGGDYAVIRTAKKYLGRRYVWGAEGPSSFDCSGFTQYVMRKTKGVRLPRVSRKQAYYGKYVTRSQLRPGDLVFFDTSRRRRGYVNHVGIYIGNGKFIHASSARHRVVITSLNSPFYRARFKWGRRIN
jgi:LysM repeat protein